MRNQASLYPSTSTNNIPRISNLTTFTSKSSLMSGHANSAQRTGKFQLLGDVLTRFSDHCTNTVTQTSSVAKSEIQVRFVTYRRSCEFRIINCHPDIIDNLLTTHNIFHFRFFGELLQLVAVVLFSRLQLSKISKNVFLIFHFIFLKIFYFRHMIIDSNYI